MRAREPERFEFQGESLWVLASRFMAPGTMARVGDGPFQAPPDMIEKLRRLGAPTDAEGWE